MNFQLIRLQRRRPDFGSEGDFNGSASGVAEPHGRKRILENFQLISKENSQTALFCLFFNRILKRCINFSRVWTKITNCCEILRKFCIKIKFEFLTIFGNVIAKNRGSEITAFFYNFFPFRRESRSLCSPWRCLWFPNIYVMLYRTSLIFIHTHLFPHLSCKFGLTPNLENGNRRQRCYIFPRLNSFTSHLRLCLLLRVWTWPCCYIIVFYNSSELFLNVDICVKESSLLGNFSCIHILHELMSLYKFSWVHILNQSSAWCCAVFRGLGFQTSESAPPPPAGPPPRPAITLNTRIFSYVPHWLGELVIR